jgi:hypothetical protein
MNNEIREKYIDLYRLIKNSYPGNELISQISGLCESKINKEEIFKRIKETQEYIKELKNYETKSSRVTINPSFEIDEESIVKFIKRRKRSLGYFRTSYLKVEGEKWNQEEFINRNKIIDMIKKLKEHNIGTIFYTISKSQMNTTKFYFSIENITKLINESDETIVIPVLKQEVIRLILESDKKLINWENVERCLRPVLMVYRLENKVNSI